MDIYQLVRKNIQQLSPYSCARDEFKGEASIYLDANESPYNAPYNRYPDPLQVEVKKEIAKLKKIDPKQIFLGNGSDEPIDLIYRVFCEPRQDSVLAISPTYGMYKVCADINNIAYYTVSLNDHFDITADTILAATTTETKVIWLCSPNNPTGNSLNSSEIELLLQRFKGIVVVDEAYIDFSSQPSFVQKLHRYPQLVVLQTFSKAWGSAAVRLGMAFASETIVQLLNRIKYPYNVNLLTQNYILKRIKQADTIQQQIKQTLTERRILIEKLATLSVVQHIYPTDANFVLVKVEDANGLYQSLVDKGTIVRNRNSVQLCQGCLRITVGTSQENETLIQQIIELTQ